jgi:hypothetical protein
VLSVEIVAVSGNVAVVEIVIVLDSGRGGDEGSGGTAAEPDEDH